MPRLVFINRVYWPSTEATAQILRDLTRGLANSGIDVLVITSTPLPQGFQDDIPRLKVLRTLRGSNTNTGLIKKLRGYSAFLKSTKIVLKSSLMQGDNVVAMTDPPMLGANIGPLVRNSGCHMWHWSQDLYPEVALAIKPIGILTNILHLLKPRRNDEWNQSSGIVAIGEDMKQRIAQTGVPETKITVSPNWAPSDLHTSNQSSQRCEWNIPIDSFVVSYSGNLGRAHVLAPIIDLVEQLQFESKIHTVIVGKGPQKPDLQNAINSRNLKRCDFHSPVPVEKLGNSLSAANVHLITMRSDCVGTVWPSKFYGIIEAQRPIVFIGPKKAEIASIIRDNELGIAVEPSHIKEAAEFIIGLSTNPKRQNEYRLRIEEFSSRQSGLKAAIALWANIATLDT